MDVNKERRLRMSPSLYAMIYIEREDKRDIKMIKSVGTRL